VSTDGTHPDIPDAEPPPVAVEDSPLAQRGPFFRRMAKRKASERDAVITVTADDADRGVGKTALAVSIAKVLDTSSDGFAAERKATLDVPEFLSLYDELEEGSALILDEAEQLDSRRSQSHENVDATHKMQTRRVNEIVAILTLPSPQVMDKRVELLQDFWINVTARGNAIVYKKRVHPIKKSIYYERLQRLSWPNMDGDRDYQILSKLKSHYIDDPESDDNWIRKDTADEWVEQAEKRAARETRDRIIRSMVEEFKHRRALDLTYDDFADVVDLSPGRIGQIYRGDA
jgi:hypothetical protein